MSCRWPTDRPTRADRKQQRKKVLHFLRNPYEGSSQSVLRERIAESRRLRDERIMRGIVRHARRLVAGTVLIGSVFS